MDSSSAISIHSLDPIRILCLDKDCCSSSGTAYRESWTAKHDNSGAKLLPIIRSRRASSKCCLAAWLSPPQRTEDHRHSVQDRPTASVDLPHRVRGDAIQPRAFFFFLLWQPSSFILRRSGYVLGSSLPFTDDEPAMKSPRTYRQQKFPVFPPQIDAVSCNLHGRRHGYPPLVDAAGAHSILPDRSWGQSERPARYAAGTDTVRSQGM